MHVPHIAHDGSGGGVHEETAFRLHWRLLALAAGHVPLPTLSLERKDTASGGGAEWAQGGGGAVADPPLLLGGEVVLVLGREGKSGNL